MAKNKQFSKVALGAALAGVVGYVAGILSAPKSGKQMRDALKERTDKPIETAEEKLKQLHRELSELVSSAVNEDKELADKSRQKFNEALKLTKQTRDKVAKVIDGVKKGGSEDKDLDRAIKEAEKAVAHAKNFLLKK